MTRRKRRSVSTQETKDGRIISIIITVKPVRCFAATVSSYVMASSGYLGNMRWVAWVPGDELNKACVLDTWGTNLSD
jgi:hypothetical protein